MTIEGPIDGQQTNDIEILSIRRCWNAGRTLSQAFKYARQRHGMASPAKAIREWRKMRRLFGHGCCRLDYVNGLRYRRPSVESLNADVGGMTYGEWKGITGPGKQLRDILK